MNAKKIEQHGLSDAVAEYSDLDLDVVAGAVNSVEPASWGLINALDDGQLEDLRKEFGCKKRDFSKAWAVYDRAHKNALTELFFSRLKDESEALGRENAADRGSELTVEELAELVGDDESYGADLTEALGSQKANKLFSVSHAAYEEAASLYSAAYRATLVAIYEERKSAGES